MKKSLLLIVLFSAFIFQVNATKIITVEAGTSCSTLKEAYDQIIVNSNNEVTETYYIYLIGNVLVQANTTKTLVWQKSGTSNYKIYIKSKYSTNRATLKRSNNDTKKNQTLINLRLVKYVFLQNIDFTDAENAIALINSNYCEVKNCNFYIGNFDLAKIGNGAITLSNKDGDESPTQSRYNKILENTIIFLKYSYHENLRFIHGIYLAHAGNNEVKRNIIINAPGGWNPHVAQLYYE